MRLFMAAFTRALPDKAQAKFMASFNAEVISQRMIAPTAATIPLERHGMSAQIANRSPYGIDENFFGKVHEPLVALFNETDYEIPSVAPKGIVFMGKLTTTAPEQPWMFQVAVLDVGESGKRYGLAQCRRDISKSDCAECLDNQMATFSAMIRNKGGWQIGSGCNSGIP
ncbi:hypothetical protein NL676_025874 [Syzygium grande]|nr:hypothetical protein NL676_025874 [Syzygium grande]